MAERRIVRFLKARYGRVTYPISTEDLKVLLERFVSDLDQYYEFDSPDVEGKTDFVPGEKPRVKIARRLTEDPVYENRLRTTLTHELGHVILHKRLYDEGLQLGSCTHSCTDADVATESTDWMEWHAGYLSGAFLIPMRALDYTRRVFQGFDPLAPPLENGSPEAREFTRLVAQRYQTSIACASVRLEQLGILYAPLSQQELAALAMKASSETGLTHCSQWLPVIAARVGMRVNAGM